MISVRRERLFAEVRIARQVSHPNICRVYDISEIEGRHFLTMEYIDGEDLASLLKRIGSLHGTKAVDVAQQLCAGLALLLAFALYASRPSLGGQPLFGRATLED